MTEMIERVAKAIWSLNEDTDCPDYDELAPHAKHRAQAWARAAIVAMLEPTHKMEDAFYNEPHTNARAKWRAMIDGALGVFQSP
jgi:hypothetical protein